MSRFEVGDKVRVKENAEGLEQLSGWEGDVWLIQQDAPPITVFFRNVAFDFWESELDPVEPSEGGE